MTRLSDHAKSIDCKYSMPAIDRLTPSFHVGWLRTSVSIAKSGFQESGGIILAIPYCEACGAIFLIYAKGSLNSSSVGLYVGASCKSCGLIFLLLSRLAVICPLRSTLLMSRGSECIALKGSGATAGLFAFPVLFAFPRVDAVLLFVPLAGEARMVELDAVVDIGT
jgi:hypothetical protein